MSRRFAFLSCIAAALLVGIGAAAVSIQSAASFLNAPAGVGVTFQPVPLPNVRWLVGQPIPAGLARADAFTPGVLDLVEGQHVIQSEAQMRTVWKRLFVAPYDATLFDFQHTFVVLMGGGAMDITTFDISAVEDVAAAWTGSFPQQNPDIDRFIAVTATTFIPGTYPQNPPPPTYRIAAVKVPRAYLDDVVFHRTIVAGI